MRRSIFISMVLISIATAAMAEMISIPKTGQTVSYAAGDDGDKQTGVAWSSPRFINNNDGTVTDSFTGLMWLKDGDCAKKAAMIMTE